MTKHTYIFVQVLIRKMDGKWSIIKDHASSSEKGEIYSK